MTAISNNLSAYAPDDGPLTAKQIAALRKDAAIHLPQGKTLFREDFIGRHCEQSAGIQESWIAALRSQ